MTKNSNMTIVEAIIEVMNDNSDGMTDKEVYSAIIAKKLYRFGALDPVSAVRAKLRSHCAGLDFPSASNKVPFNDVQRFIGALEKYQKGVFITTSSFTDDSQNEADRSIKSVFLIDGDKLTDLMLDYGAGATVTEQISIYKIDEDYFN